MPKTLPPNRKRDIMPNKIYPPRKMASQVMMIKFIDIVARRTLMTNMLRGDMLPKILAKSKRTSYPHRWSLLLTTKMEHTIMPKMKMLRGVRKCRPNLIGRSLSSRTKI